MSESIPRAAVILQDLVYRLLQVRAYVTVCRSLQNRRLVKNYWGTSGLAFMFGPLLEACFTGSRLHHFLKTFTTKYAEKCSRPSMPVVLASCIGLQFTRLLSSFIQPGRIKIISVSTLECLTHLWVSSTSLASKRISLIGKRSQNRCVQYCDHFPCPL